MQFENSKNPRSVVIPKRGLVARGICWVKFQLLVTQFSVLSFSFLQPRAEEPGRECR